MTEAATERLVVPVEASPWRGRLVVGAGILVAALSMRMAVTSISPLLQRISGDIGLDATARTALGLMPTLAFALFTIATPRLAARFSAEWCILVAMALAAAGQVVRALSGETFGFLGGTLLALAALGVTTAVLPVLVKRHFPSRIGTMMAVYIVLFTIGTAVTPLLAVPLADAAGWRFSIGVWAAVNLVAVVPWIVHVARRPKVARAQAPRRVPVLRSPLAWGLAVMYGCAIAHVYSMFAWLPSYLVDTGSSEAEAGALLALYAYAGIPLAFAMPAFAVRLQNPFPVVIVLAALFVAGYTGLLLQPGSTAWIWVVLLGLAPGAFPLSMSLIGLRTRTPEGAMALSGFGQGVGFLIAGIGPLGVDLLHAVTGSWWPAFGFLVVLLIPQLVGAAAACRPRFLEDRSIRPTHP